MTFVLRFLQLLACFRTSVLLSFFKVNLFCTSVIQVNSLVILWMFMLHDFIMHAHPVEVL